MDNLFVYKNISQCVTMAGVAAKQGRRPTEADLGVIADAAVVVDNDNQTIAWIGATKELPREYRDLVSHDDNEGSVWMPELVECHTHLVYGGSRHHDYALRSTGKTYQQVAEAGGGILSTLAWTRESSFEELLAGALAEVERFKKYGVGCIEVKSGYGLDLESEIKILEVVRELQKQEDLTVVATFLPAHATPPEFRGRTQDYVDLIRKEWIPTIAKKKLARFFDVFVEEGYFSVAQARELALSAKEHGFGIKLHVDQFNDLGAVPLAIELEAASVDHLDHTSDENIRRLGDSNTVAVLLPGASLFTGTPYPPARKLIDAGARVALSTDYNPGTCPSRNLPLMTTLACSQMKMTVPEALAAITYNAAAALGLEEEYGVLAAGRPFRVSTLKAESYEVLPYCFGELE